nr:PREDICTED: protein D1-like [Bemisia tabaci]
MVGGELMVVVAWVTSSLVVHCLGQKDARFWNKNRPDRDEFPSTPEEIELRLLEDKIIPDVVHKAPKDYLKVEYKSKARINLGQVVRCGDTTPDPPISITWPAAESDYYTLLLTDRDASLEIPPIAPEWQHWMVVNIHGSKWKEGDVRTAYMGAFIPNWLTYDTGPHRFVFTLWRQKNGLTNFQQKFIHNLVFDLRRTNFSTPLFAEKYNLDLVAINYFRADWHEMPHDRESLLRPPTPSTPRPTYWNVASDEPEKSTKHICDDNCFA